MIDLFKYIYYWFVVFLVRIFCFIFCPIKVIGKENIPLHGGMIVAANHASNMDPPLLAVANPRRMKFMAKESLFSNPIFRWIMTTGGGFPVRRGATDKKAIKQFLDFLHDGWPVMIFPQGTRLGQKPQTGVGFLAVKSSAPVLPVYLSGTDQLLPKGRIFPKRCSITIIFGKPFTVASDMPYEQAAEMIMKEILDLNMKSK